MAEKAEYLVQITPEAEVFFLNLSDYLHRTHSTESANRKMDELLKKAASLNHNPRRGTLEKKLAFMGRQHRFLVYQVTRRKTVKIIYFIEEATKRVFVTDFFGTEMDDTRISDRNR